MNPNPVIITPDELNVVGFSESPGRRLRVQRQSRGFEIERIAAQLHLRVAAVEALEQDRYQDLPGPVFVAGYLRNYARLVGLDPQPLVAAFRAANPTLESDGLPVGALPRRELGSSHILIRLISLALLAAVVATLVLWWQNRAEVLATATPAPDLPARLPPLPAEPPAASEVRPAAPITDTGASSAGLPGAVQPSPTGGSTPLPLPAAPPAETPTTTPGAIPQATVAATPDNLVPANPANPLEVALSFSAPTWISVRDATGAAILTGDMRTGDTRVLGGRPPYSFVIGKAASAAITIGGQPFVPKARVQGGVARFKLDPSKPQ